MESWDCQSEFEGYSSVQIYIVNIVVAMGTLFIENSTNIVNIVVAMGTLLFIDNYFATTGTRSGHAGCLAQFPPPSPPPLPLPSFLT